MQVPHVPQSHTSSVAQLANACIALRTSLLQRREIVAEQQFFIAHVEVEPMLQQEGCQPFNKKMEKFLKALWQRECDCGHGSLHFCPLVVGLGEATYEIDVHSQMVAWKW